MSCYPCRTRARQLCRPRPGQRRSRSSTPVTRIPTASSRATVVSRPAGPASCAWLFATLPTIATVLSAKRRSAAAAFGGCRNAKQLDDFGPHLRGAGPEPIAPSTFSRTRSAPARNGLSDGAMLSGSGRMPYERQSVSPAERAHLGSRLVPSVTSPPAQTRNGVERGFGLADSAGVDVADWASALEPKTKVVNDDSASEPAFTAVR